MSASHDHTAPAGAHQIILFRRGGEDHFACTCGVRTKVSSTSGQSNRAAILKSFACSHLDAVRRGRGERPEQ